MPFSIKRLFLQTIGKIIPSDYFSHRFPVSIKGVFLIENKVVLLKNERGEWDLPGGKLNQKESFINCLQREIKEELNISVSVDKFISANKLRIFDKIDVVILVYYCTTIAKINEIQISGESFEVGFFDEKELDKVNIPKIYLNIIQQFYKE